MLKKSNIFNPHTLCLTIALSAAVFALIIPASVQANGGDAGVNSGQFLRLPIGARGPAMGDAMTPIAMGAEAVHYNPAGVVHNRSGNMSLSFNKLTQGITQGDVFYVQPFAENWTVGAGVKYIDYGAFDQTTIRSPGDNIIVNDNGTFGANDISTNITLGYKTAYNYSLGGTIKLIRRDISGVNASGVAADFGYQSWSDYYDITWGAAIKNIGTDIQFDKRSERLPRVIRGGVGYAPAPSLKITLDAEKEQGVEADYLFGAEWRVFNRFFIRGGYNTRSDISSNLAGGIGINLPYLTFNYSYQPFNEFGNKNRFEVTFYL